MRSITAYVLNIRLDLGALLKAGRIVFTLLSEFSITMHIFVADEHPLMVFA